MVLPIRIYKRFQSDLLLYIIHRHDFLQDLYNSGFVHSKKNGGWWYIVKAGSKIIKMVAIVNSFAQKIGDSPSV